MAFLKEKCHVRHISKYEKIYPFCLLYCIKFIIFAIQLNPSDGHEQTLSIQGI